MARSPSVESSASNKSSSKKKGVRSVLSLTPTQLARKRANDREAQRAIRARTKEHIERLERELEEVKSRRGRDETVQALIRRNRQLEKEVAALRKGQAVPSHPPFTSAGYDEQHLGLNGSGLSSRASSFGRPSSEYSGAATPEYATATQYVGAADACDPWTVLPCSVSSTVSSPSSSAGNADEYIPAYIPTSVPPSIMDGQGMVQQQMSSAPSEARDGGARTADNDGSERNYPQSNTPVTMPPAYLQQQAWNMYPMYYSQSSAL